MKESYISKPNVKGQSADTEGGRPSQNNKTNHGNLSRRGGIGLICSVLFAPVLTVLGHQSNPIKCLADVEDFLNRETGSSRAVIQNYLYGYLVAGHSSIFMTNLQNVLQQNHKARQIVESLRGEVHCREQYAEMRLIPQLIH